MKSPFPGMDPYLEHFWGDVHQGLITYLRDQLQPALPGDLIARMEERVYVDAPSVDQRYFPDIRVAEWPRRRTGGGTAVAEVAAPARVGNGIHSPAEPIVISIAAEPVTEGYIQILDAKTGGRVVTSIEVLSPSNKHAGEGQRAFLKKRRDMMEAGVNLVDVDLLREGNRLLMVSPDRVPRSHQTAYQISAWRADRPDDFLLYKVPLRERLPIIKIPLRPEDPDVLLDIQAALDLAYRNGRYDTIDYTQEPDPRLDPDDTAWADVLLKERGLR